MSERIGTGKWRQAGVPHRGWTCVGVEDLEEPAHTCEMCEVMMVRYVHAMEHPNYETLQVGCICAGHMEQDLVGARRREAEFKSTRRWLTRKLEKPWPVSTKGNAFLNIDGFNIVIYQRGKYWGGRVEHIATGQRRVSRLPYDSKEAVKLASLKVIVI